MGKYAQYLKRGSSRSLGNVAPPLVADWSFTAAGGGGVTATRVSAPPPGSTGIWVSYSVTGALPWTAPVFAATTTTQSGLGVGVTALSHIAWGTSVARLSDWSANKSVVVT